MKNKYLGIFLVLLQLIFSGLLLSHEGKEDVVVWIRAFGDDAKNEIVPYVRYLHEELDTAFNLKILVATNYDDPVAHVLMHETPLPSVHIVFGHMKSNHQGLNALVEATPSDSFLLSLSLGVKIKRHHLAEALQCVQNGAWVYGWKISNMQNDGSKPGLGWYNTAALYSKPCLNWLKNNPFPYWIDNGVEGYIEIDNEKIAIGNNEEVVLMASILQQGYHSAYYILNVADPLEFTHQTGNGISFNAKMKRKIYAAKYYLDHKFCVSADEVWSRLRIIH